LSRVRSKKSHPPQRLRNLSTAIEFAIRVLRESLMARSPSERPFPPAPTQTTRRNVLIALPAVAAAQASIPASADEKETEPAPEWSESEHVRQFYKLARF
jgi:hypothetical protein